MTTKITLPNIDKEFDGVSKIDGALSAFVAQISSAIKLPIALPKSGNRLEALERYVCTFTDEKLNLFIEKLATSQYVKNPKFSLEFMIRHDVINFVLTGVKDSAKTSKYYNIQYLHV